MKADPNVLNIKDLITVATLQWRSIVPQNSFVLFIDLLTACPHRLASANSLKEVLATEGFRLGYTLLNKRSRFAVREVYTPP